MMTRKEIDLSKALTEAQKKMLEEMNANPAIPDDDCPEYTEAEMVHIQKRLKQSPVVPVLQKKIGGYEK